MGKKIGKKLLSTSELIKEKINEIINKPDVKLSPTEQAVKDMSEYLNAVVKIQIEQNTGEVPIALPITFLPLFQPRYRKFSEEGEVLSLDCGYVVRIKHYMSDGLYVIKTYEDEDGNEVDVKGMRTQYLFVSNLDKKHRWLFFYEVDTKDSVHSNVIKDIDNKKKTLKKELEKDVIIY